MAFRTKTSVIAESQAVHRAERKLLEAGQTSTPITEPKTIDLDLPVSA
jgi:hypothetical protein